MTLDERPDVPPSFEDAEDALMDGDRPLARRGARAALAHRTFRTVFVGAFLSNIGSWMQNVVLSALAYKLTKSSTFVGLVVIAQLGPQLLLSLIGGVLADLVDRRWLIILISIEQLVFSLLLAEVVRSPDPSHALLLGCVAAIGVGQAFFIPTYSALLPSLVPREDLAGAISLNSAQMNASRVVGPAIGGVAYAAFGAAWVFAANAVTYLFVIAALWIVRLPLVESDWTSGTGLRRLASGFVIAKGDRVIARCLVTITVFSLFCLPFIGQMPVVAARNLHLDPKSTAYGLLYACFGLGAVIGALSIGTVFAGRDLARLTRQGLAGFAIALGLFGAVHQKPPAYAVILLVGLTYFASVTSLSTILQERLADNQRGRVMAIWSMGFGGMVPVGSLAAGPLIDASSPTVVLLGGAVVAAVLIGYARLRDGP